jgi:hypothetical protein
MVHNSRLSLSPFHLNVETESVSTFRWKRKRENLLYHLQRPRLAFSVVYIPKWSITVGSLSPLSIWMWRQNLSPHSDRKGERENLFYHLQRPRLVFSVVSIPKWPTTVGSLSSLSTLRWRQSFYKMLQVVLAWDNNRCPKHSTSYTCIY